MVPLALAVPPRALVLRPLEPSDDDALRSVFDAMSDESRRRRFCAPKRELTPGDLRAMCAVDHRTHAALLALTPAGEPIGVARYAVAGDDGTAELAFEVADAWHGRGIGTWLVHTLARRAAAVGVRRLSAVTLPGNLPALRLLRRAGFTLVGRQGSTVELVATLPLCVAPPSGPPPVAVAWAAR